MSRLIKIGAKVGIVGSVFYYSAQYGLWQDSKTSEKIYKELYSLITPYIKEAPVEIPEIPKASEISLYAKSSWNKGVMASAKFLSNLPSHVCSLVDKTTLAIKDLSSEKSNEA